MLHDQGPNSRSARRIQLTSTEEVAGSAGTTESYVAQTIAVEDAGLEVPAEELVLVDELRERLDEDPELEAAFEGLTPGRQREYTNRSEGRVIAGVCAAIADRFGVSRTLVRVLFVVFGLVGAGEVAYLVLWILIPKRTQP